MRVLQHAKMCIEKTHDAPWPKGFLSYFRARVVSMHDTHLPVKNMEKKVSRNVRFRYTTGVNGMCLGGHFWPTRMTWEER